MVLDVGDHLTLKSKLRSLAGRSTHQTVPELEQQQGDLTTINGVNQQVDSEKTKQNRRHLVVNMTLDNSELIQC